MKLTININVRSKGQAQRIVARLGFRFRDRLIDAKLGTRPVESFEEKSPAHFMKDMEAAQLAKQKRQTRILGKMQEMTMEELKEFALYKGLTHNEIKDETRQGIIDKIVEKYFNPTNNGE